MNENVDLFFERQIRNSKEPAKIFIDWDENMEQKFMSGNEFYLEKKGNMIETGDLFDDETELELIPEQVLSDRLRKV